MLSFLLSSTGSNAISASEARQIAGSTFLLLSSRLKKRPTDCKIAKNLQTVTIVLPRVAFFHHRTRVCHGLRWWLLQAVCGPQRMQTSSQHWQQHQVLARWHLLRCWVLLPAQLLHLATSRAIVIMPAPPFFSCGDLSPHEYSGVYCDARIHALTNSRRYTRPAGSFLGRQFYQKMTPDDLKNYKIPVYPLMSMFSLPRPRASQSRKFSRAYSRSKSMLVCWLELLY